MELSPPLSPSTPIVAFVDLGSNSVRLMVVRINPTKSYTVLTRYKQMVRLGEGVFTARRLAEAAVRRTIDALRNIAEICRGYEAGEIVALATAAVRDAADGAEFAERAAAESGIALDIVSGLEEARLIHLGVRTALPPFEGATVFIDIGGGSTELTVEPPGGEAHYDSLKLGCVRITNAFPELAGRGRVSSELYEEICAHVRQNALRSVQKLRQSAPAQRLRMVGSSGTIQNLAEISAQAARPQRNGSGAPLSLSLKDLANLAKKLCGLTLEERAKIPGINPQRADVIVGGAAILQTLMDELGVREVAVSSRGLLDGMLQDYLERGRWGYLDGAVSAREQSALQLARSCHFDETHARWMTRLALSLFDSAREAGLHRYGAAERELLYFAGLLHDIGLFLSFSNHHEHTRYMIENAELLGFHRSEIEIIAASASMHRKWSARKTGRAGGLPPSTLTDEQRELAATLGLFLRMAECLERSQQQTVLDARLEPRGKKLALRVRLLRDSPAELLSILDCRGAVKKRFGRTFEVEAEQGAPAPGR